MNRSISIAVLGVLFGSSLFASDKVDRQEVVRRMEQAVAKTDIFELSSFVMEATVEIDDHGKPISGTYQLLWNGPDQWREAISLPGYYEVQTGGKGTIWLQRSSDFIPFPIYSLHRALGFGSSAAGSGLVSGAWSLVQLGITPKDTVTKKHERKEHGDKVTCFEIEDEQKLTSEICINDTTDTINRNSSLADRDFQPVGGKMFPRSLSALEKAKTVATVNVKSLITPGQFPPNAFSPPDGVSPRPGCMNPTPPRLVKKQAPEYPEKARMQHIQGTTTVRVLIGTDGVPKIRNAMKGPTPDLEAASARAITQWRYDPALCNGQPVEVETLVQTDYTLSPH
jgi:TonB family protein